MVAMADTASYLIFFWSFLSQDLGACDIYDICMSIWCSKACQLDLLRIPLDLIRFDFLNLLDPIRFQWT